MQTGAPSPFFSWASLLWMFSRLYGGAVKLRERLYQENLLRARKLPCTVLSIGNLTAGGTGKTPMAMYLARLVKDSGWEVAVISRGYKGAAEKTVAVVSDGRGNCVGPETAGDEPFLIANRLRDIPVIVGQDRYAAGLRAIKEFDPDVLVLDDAFQHLPLARDINLVLLDYTHPFGNTHLLPRGTLREPVSALLRADAFVLTRCDTVSDATGTKQLAPGEKFMREKPVFKARHMPYLLKAGNCEAGVARMPLESVSRCDAAILKGRKVFAFSGIARNDDFRRTLHEFSCDIKGFLGFPDHHRYSDNDLLRILATVRRSGADLVMTTEKDYARIHHRITWPIDLMLLGVEISFGNDDNAFNAYIRRSLERHKTNRFVSIGCKDR